MILIKNADVYAPEHLGIKDVLICGAQIDLRRLHYGRDL